MAPAHTGHGSMVEYTVAPASRPPADTARPRRAPQAPAPPVPRHAALGVLSVLARRQHDTVAHKDRSHRPVAPGKGILRLAQRPIHIVGVGHARDCKLRGL